MSSKECDYDEGDSWDDEHPFGMDPGGQGGIFSINLLNILLIKVPGFLSHKSKIPFTIW